jgi:predicted nucleic acid-binding protein
MTKYVLDACAVLALISNEPGQEIVSKIFDEADAMTAELLMHKANLLEVYYDRIRALGKIGASEFLSEFTDCPIAIISDISDAIFEEAARLKSLYKVSFADTFALATASVSGGILLTADHHEMDKVEQSESGIRFRWIR